MPPKRRPISRPFALALRRRSIPKAVACSLSAAHSQHTRPRSFHDVSSTLARSDVRTAPRASRYDECRASLSRRSQSLILPSDIFTPKISPSSRCVSRTLTRYTPRSAPASVVSRGPKAPVGTPSGRTAVVTARQRRHRALCSRCSRTVTSTRGSTVTWCRYGSPMPCSRSSCPHASQRSGRCSLVSSTLDGSTSSRAVPSWPGCPPCLRPLRGLRPRRRLDHAGSDDGGLELLRESRFRRDSSSSMRRRCFASRRSSSSIQARRPSTIARRSSSCRSPTTS